MIVDTRPNLIEGVEARDPETGEVLGESAVGEVALRTPTAMLGYWNNPEATAEALDAERWYRTGDFGRGDDGLYSSPQLLDPARPRHVCRRLTASAD